MSDEYICCGICGCGDCAEGSLCQAKPPDPTITDERIAEIKHCATVWKVSLGQMYRVDVLAIIARLEAVTRERDGMKVIIGKMPVTADGVPVVPGMVTYCDNKRPFPHHWDMRLRTGEDYETHCRKERERQYSSREAAIAAGAGGT